MDSINLGKGNNFTNTLRNLFFRCGTPHIVYFNQLSRVFALANENGFARMRDFGVYNKQYLSLQ